MNYLRMFKYCAAILFFAVMSGAVPPAKTFFSEKNHFEKVITEWRKTTDMKKRKAIWLENTHANWKLYLSEIQGAKRSEKAYWEGRVQRWLHENNPTDLSADLLRNNYQLITAILEPSFVKLNSVIKIDKPIDVYFIPSIVPFGLKEFIKSGAPALAVNVAFREFGTTEEISSLVIHESTHVLHFRNHSVSEQKIIKAEPLGMALSEGLSVYVVKKLFPDKETPFWSNLKPSHFDRCNAKLKKNAAQFSADLNMSGKEFDKKYFRIREDDQDMPPRCGYWISYLVVEGLLRTRTLEDVLKMSKNQYKPLFKSFLETLR